MLSRDDQKGLKEVSDVQCNTRLHSILQFDNEDDPTTNKIKSTWTLALHYSDCYGMADFEAMAMQ